VLSLRYGRPRPAYIRPDRGLHDGRKAANLYRASKCPMLVSTRTYMLQLDPADVALTDLSSTLTVTVSVALGRPSAGTWKRGDHGAAATSSRSCGHFVTRLIRALGGRFFLG
jgi:hypothetical protein